MRAAHETRDPAPADRLWAGYHPLAMAPLIALTAVLSLLAWTGRWYLQHISDLGEEIGDWAMFAVAWGVWPVIVGVFLYRTVTFTYRLTDRNVLVDFGPLCLPTAPLRLTELDEVVVREGWLLRLLGVGAVELRSGSRRVRLRGVLRPAEFAARVRAGAEAARAPRG